MSTEKLTRDDVSRLQRAEFTSGPLKGQRKVDHDLAYRREVRDAWREVLGDGAQPNRQVDFEKE